MSLEAIITLTVFALMIVGVIVCATTLHHRCKSTLGHGLPLFAVDVIQVDTSLKELDQIDKRYWQFAIPVNPI